MCVNTQNAVKFSFKKSMGVSYWLFCDNKIILCIRTVKKFSKIVC